jgi:hypothetical protein
MKLERLQAIANKAAKRLQTKLQSGCKPVAKRFWSDSEAILKRFWSDSEATARRQRTLLVHRLFIAYSSLSVSSMLSHHSLQAFPSLSHRSPIRKLHLIIKIYHATSLRSKIETSTFVLECLQTLTGIKFIITAVPGTTDILELLNGTFYCL